MVNQQGIEANLEKIKELLGMSSPQKQKEVMSLAEKVVVLSSSFHKLQIVVSHSLT